MGLADLPIVSQREAIRAFERLGCEHRKGGKGSHAKLRAPNGRTLTIPNHKELKPALLGSQITSAGFTFQQFADAV